MPASVKSEMRPAISAMNRNLGRRNTARKDEDQDKGNEQT
jgi:hypothetical protein